jgi:hypothetical protein
MDRCLDDSTYYKARFACTYRLEEYYYTAAKAPHYPEAYLESKHTVPFAHWRSPKGVRHLFLTLHGAHMTCLRTAVIITLSLVTKII